MLKHSNAVVRASGLCGQEATLALDKTWMSTPYLYSSSLKAAGKKHLERPTLDRNMIAGVGLIVRTLLASVLELLILRTIRDMSWGT